ncbi:MAG: hypothetical protein KGL53_06590 [Elusimicrobia bacterium]|nr:hypothetical protein [Elusimicrobiota bacterium]
MAAPEELDPETGGEARLVESGSFRVDRSRALDKLTAFRRRDVGCVMLFARAASASGAKRLSIDDEGRLIRLRFDGPGFDRGELADPYAALFSDEKAVKPGLRWLALAFVHAWRPSLQSLSVLSGTADKRLRLTATGMGRERVDPAEPDEAAWNEVALTLNHSDEALWRHPVPAESLACLPRSHLWGRLEVTVLRGGKEAAKAAPRPAGPGELVFDADGRYGHISIPSGVTGQSVVDAYLEGVYAGPLSWDGGPAPIVGKVEDPGLALDASLAALVRNERSDRTVALLRAQAGALVAKVAAEQGPRMEETARLLSRSAELRTLWRQRLRGPSVEREWRLGWGAKLRALLMSRSWQDEVQKVLYGACATAWLRELAARDAGLDADARGRLEAVPLAFAVGLRPTSAAEMRSALRRKALTLSREPARSSREGTLSVWQDGSPSEFWKPFDLGAAKSL